MALRLRAMTDVERREIERVAQGQRVPAIAQHLHVGADTVRLWIKRFNTDGRAGLVDAPRSGHPPTYTAEQVSEVIAVSLTKPTELGLPFARWTLDRLAAYLNEEKGIPIKRSRIDDLLLAEGLRWRTQEGWFGERASREPPEEASASAGDKPIAPEFARKRGRLSPSTRRRREAA